MLVIGGIAGKGGIINASTNSKIFAYNGNECTLDSSETSYYNKPLDIFAQNGTLREVRKYSTYFNVREGRTIKFFKEVFGETINPQIDSFTSDTVGNAICHHNYIIRFGVTNEKIKTSYVNPDTKSCQGIGSGAGYIELDNGTFEQK